MKAHPAGIATVTLIWCPHSSEPPWLPIPMQSQHCPSSVQTPWQLEPPTSSPGRASRQSHPALALLHARSHIPSPFLQQRDGLSAIWVDVVPIAEKMQHRFIAPRWVARPLRQHVQQREDCRLRGLCNRGHLLDTLAVSAIKCVKQSVADRIAVTVVNPIVECTPLQSETYIHTDRQTDRQDRQDRQGRQGRQAA